MSRLKQIMIFCCFISIVSYSQSWEELQLKYNNELGQESFKEADNTSTAILTYAKKVFGDTSLNYSLANFYKGDVKFLMGEDIAALNYFLLSKEYFKTNSQKRCGFYHVVIFRLSYYYFVTEQVEKAAAQFEELFQLDKLCQTLSRSDIDNAIKVYLESCMEIPAKRGWASKELFKRIEFDVETINSYIDSISRTEIENYLLSNTLISVELLLTDALLYNDFNAAFNVYDLLNKIKYKSSNPKFNYRFNEIKKSYYLGIGDQESFLKTVEEEIKILEMNQDVFENLSDRDYYLGTLYSNKKDYKSAIIYYNRAAEYCLKSKVSSNINPLNTIFHYLAYCYSKTGNYSQAINTIEKELTYLTNNNLLTEKNLESVNLSLARYNYYNNNFIRAKKIFEEELKKLEFNAKSRHYREYLGLRIEISRKENNWNQCLTYIKKAYDYDLKGLNELLTISSKKERESYWENNKYLFESYYSIIKAAYLTNQEYLIIGYNISLLTRSLLLESDLSFNRELANSKNSILVSLFDSFKQAQLYLGKLKTEGSGNIELISKLEHQADSLDLVLSRKMSAYADYKKNFSLTWKDVQTNLNNDEAAIEFARYYDDKDSAIHYMALVLKQGDKSPSLIRLCSEDELKRYSPEKELNELYSLLWKPISNQLTGIKTVYYTPAGLLNNIPFQALYEDKTEGREYLMDKHSLNQLTSTRYLALGLKKRAQEPIETSIALFGGVNYNDLPDSKSDSFNLSSEAAFLYKNAITTRNLEDTRSGASYLPGTKKEVENIGDLLKNNKWDVNVIEGKNASEDKVKNLVGKNSKSILHIATHGFAFPDKENNKERNEIGIETGNERYKVAENPMIRSGLLFSGSNMTWQGKGDSLLKMTNEDGVLTAYELSQLSLDNTKLVVLSACETGKGAIQGSEGTFGLKRALKLAGVDNMIVSLWKVPDDATMEMMSLFYTELAKTKLPVPSFELAQKTMRNKYPNEPKKWAGFVFVR